MKKYLISILLSVSFIFPQTAKEIIDKAEDIIKGETAHSTSKMIIITPDYERELVMESWWEGNDNALIVIKSPRKEKGNKTLKIGNEMWMYLSNTETTIKIPPSMMLQSWNGSDFTNDDLVRESNLAEDYFQEVAGEEKVDGELCWKIEMKPKPDAPVVWEKLIYWVRKSDYIPAKVEYYDEKMRLVRTMNFNNIKKMDGRMIPSEWEMINHLKEGHITKIITQDIEFNIDINPNKFSFRELEKGR